jgi:hypothetical protein
MSVRAELKFLHSPDADPLNEYQPTGDFGILVQAIIGPQSEEGEESFDFMVCTTGWFATDRLTSPGAMASGRHVLFVNKYDYPSLEKYVREYCVSCEGRTWHEVAEKLARLGHWEFEDYRQTD